MKYELRFKQRDGKEITELQCPKCGEWKEIDDDQIHGRVSIQCDDACGFHETICFSDDKPLTTPQS